MTEKSHYPGDTNENEWILWQAKQVVWEAQQASSNPGQIGWIDATAEQQKILDAKKSRKITLDSLEPPVLTEQEKIRELLYIGRLFHHYPWIIFYYAHDFTAKQQVAGHQLLPPQYKQKEIRLGDRTYRIKVLLEQNLDNKMPKLNQKCRQFSRTHQAPYRNLSNFSERAINNFYHAFQVVLQFKNQESQAAQKIMWDIKRRQRQIFQELLSPHQIDILEAIYHYFDWIIHEKSEIQGNQLLDHLISQPIPENILALKKPLGKGMVTKPLLRAIAKHVIDHFFPEKESESSVI